MIVVLNGDAFLIAMPSSVKISPGRADPSNVVSERNHLNLGIQRLAVPSAVSRTLKAKTVSRNLTFFPESMSATITLALSTSPSFRAAGGS